MKVTVLAVAASMAGTALARASIDPEFLAIFTGVMPTSMLIGVAGPFVKNVVNSGYGKQSGLMSGLFGGASGSRVEMAPRFSKQFPNSKTVKLRYGPYLVPSMKTRNGLGEGGSLWNYPDTDIAKPCSKCIIVGMNAGLEYADGSTANVNNQAWLHHFVLFSIGPGRVDATCEYAFSSLPHANVGCTPSNCERLFSSGNERTPAFMSDWASGGSTAVKPVGYHVRSTDSFAVINDFMNEDEYKSKTVYLTITYDYVDGWPSGFDDMRPVWFDVKQCGTSEAKAMSQSGAYTVSAYAWTSTMDGEILGYAGHLHDGGQLVNLAVDGKSVCDSKATYGGDPAFTAPMGAGMNMKSATTHISHMSICQGPTLNTKYMKKGQSWLLTAHYDYTKNKGVVDEDSGLQDDVMGIAIMYVRQPWNG